MKFISVVVVAVLYCAMVVSASPPFHPTIKNVISEVTRIFSCVPNAVGRTIGGNDFKSEFVQFKEEFDTVLKNDLPKCPELESINQKYSCVADSIEKLDRIYAGLIAKLSTKDKAVADEIQTNLKSECLKEIEYPIESMIKQFECGVESLEEASTTNGLTNEWNTSKPQIVKHLNEWKQCSDFFCNLKKLGYVMNLFIQFVESVAENPNFEEFLEDLKDITRQCADVK